jgi:hypothetical protein
VVRSPRFYQVVQSGIIYASGKAFLSGIPMFPGSSPSVWHPAKLHWCLTALAVPSRAWAVVQIRKAYKKLALRFHPDKALSHCRFAVQLGSCGAALADADKVSSLDLACHSAFSFFPYPSPCLCPSVPPVLGLCPYPGSRELPNLLAVL